MDAIKLLKSCNYQIRDLLEDLCDTETDESEVRSDLLAQAAATLDVHSQIKRELFYPAFLDATERESDLELIHEAIETERVIVLLLLADLDGTDVASEQFGGRCKVLRELVEHHIRDEERELFPRVKKLMSAIERKALGENLLQRKQELMGESLAA